MDSPPVILPGQLGVIPLSEPQQCREVILDLELSGYPPLLVEELRFIAIELPTHLGNNFIISVVH